jgi:hypothetical protein
MAVDQEVAAGRVLVLAHLARHERRNPMPLTCKTLAALVYAVGHDRARATALWKQSLALQPGQPDVEAFLRKLGVR